MIKNYLRSQKFKYSRFSSIVRSFLSLFPFGEVEKNFQSGMYFLELNKVEGDYVEFGVYKGSTMIMAHHFAKSRDLNMKFIGFDSFEGLPKPKKEDKNLSWKEGGYKASKKEVERNLKKYNIKDFKLIEGWYDKTLKKDKEDYGIKKIALFI